MFHKKNVILHVFSFFLLCCGFVLCRYICFDLHGMKQFPVLLFGLGIFFVLVSFLLQGKFTPVCTSFAYSIGFAAGVLLQTNGVDAGGGATNNLWILWGIVFVGMTLVGGVIDQARK